MSFHENTLPVLFGGLASAAVMAPQNVGAQRLFTGDAYTAYHLLEPGSDQFRVVFYPSESTPGATILINGTRPGSKGTDIVVTDPRTGGPMKFEYLTGEELAADGTPGSFSPGEHYIRAHLARPVPEGGEGRVLIEKTYQDARSYFMDGQDIVFERSLGVGRQSIILPKGYSLVESNVAAQVISLPDGRVQVSLSNVNDYRADVKIRGRKSTAAMGSKLRIAERAFDRTKTLYDLSPPDTHGLHLTVDYIEGQPGDRSQLELPAEPDDVQATDKDTAEPLKLSARGSLVEVLLALPITGDKQSAHIQVTARVTDPGYRLEAGELVFERVLRGVRNTVLLPRGWELTAVSVPCTVGTEEGTDRRFLRFVNGRTDDELPVALRAAKRSGKETQ